MEQREKELGNEKRKKQAEQGNIRYKQKNWKEKKQISMEEGHAGEYLV